MKVTVFKVGDLSYPDANLDKPVRYTESFLKDIASCTSSSKLTGKHGSNTGIGSLSNFIFDDGVLKADVNTEESLEGMGFSPEFNCDLIDKGEYYEAVNGLLKNTVLTDTPRSSILYNNIETKMDVNKVSDDVTNTLNNEIKKLNRELAQKDITIKNLQDKAQRYDELEGKFKKLSSENEVNVKTISELKTKAESYDKLQEARKDELLTKLCEDNPDLRDKYSDFTVDQLQTVVDTVPVSTPPNGVSPNVAAGLNDSGEETKPNIEQIEAFVKEEFGE